MSPRRPAREAPSPSSPDEPRLRPATARDLDRLQELYAHLAEQHGSAPRFALRSSRSQGLRQHLAARLRDADARLLVAEAEAPDRPGQLLGFCLVASLQRPDFFEETERLVVEAVYVQPGQRRRGLARALVEAALEALDPGRLRRVELSVARDNAPGGAFWRALGFEPVMDVLERRR